MSVPIRVLYVDDCQLDRELVRDVLEKDDGEFQVAEAAGRADFEALLAAGGWDLVLTDFRIGDFEGLEVIEIAKNKLPGVPIVMLTGTGSEEVAVEALKRGAGDYVLKKPQHIQRLPFTLRSVLERAQAQEAEHRLTRELRALTGCNQALLRAGDEQSLFAEICGIVCEVAGYRAAWVGLVDNDEDKAIRVVASAGDCGEFLAPRCFGWSGDDEHGRGPSGRAIRSGHTIYDPYVVALPLKRQDGEVIGVLTIYSVKASVVTTDELRLLEELASDLAYGVAALRSHAERRLTEEALRESDEDLRLALEASGQVLWDLNATTRQTLADPGLAKLLGLEPGQRITHDTWKSRVHEDDLPQAEARMEACLSGDEPLYEIEFRVRGASGKWRWLYSRGRVVERDPDGRPVRVAGTTGDITDRKQAEEALRQTEQQLRQSQKMEAVGQLAGGIAHDFNNMLTAILGYSEMILTGEECDPGTLRSEVEEIRAAAERASALTRQILAFSRRQALANEVVSLNEVVARAERLVRRTLGEDIEVVVPPSSDEGLANVDAGQLEQVLVNMALNARDAMPEGGRLTLETANVELDEDYCRTHPDAAPGSYVMVSVSDNGIGMDEETMSRVFEPFFTTKVPGKGTGLGLATAYGIVTQSGGSISVSSELGKGSVFRVHLPRVDGSAETGAVACSWPRPLGGRETVLLVEDEEAVKKLVERILGSLGYTVLAAGTGMEALALLEEDRPVDLLLTDVVLPGGMRGDALAQAASRVRPDLPIIFMSGYVHEWVAGAGRIQPGINYLAKPFRSEELARMVRDTLDAWTTAGP
jgi:PAS domain S-box-containing protein